MTEKIGLQAVFADQQFRSGIANYNIQIQNATIRTEDAAEKTTESTRQMGGAWQELGKVVGGFVSIYMVKQLGQAIFQLSELGATTARQRTAFEELARQAGGSSDEILAAIQRATGGTVANADIILAANKGILLGLGAQADQWEKLAEVARFRARAMGISVTQALDDITTGIGRQSKLILDNLGIVFDTQQVYDDYAASIGRTGDSLTEMEKKQALTNAVIEEGQAQIQAAGGIAEDAADKYEQLAAKMENLREEAGTRLLPAIGEIVTDLGKLIDVVVLVGTWFDELEKRTGDLTVAMDALKWSLGPIIPFLELQWNVLTGLTDANIALQEEFAGTSAAVGGVIPPTKEATEAAEDYAAALAGVNVVIAETEQLTDAQIKGMERAARAYHKQIEERNRAAEKAEKERLREQEQALREMERNELSYSNALAQLYDQIVSTQERAAEERLQVERDYVADVLALDQQLARDREEIDRSLARDLARSRTRYNQRREDELRDLNRDLADLEADLATENKETWADYYATLEQLELAHGERMAALTERHAQERADVEAKYDPEPPEDTLDEQREALQEELRLLQEAREKAHGVASQREKEVIAALDQLKDKELALLEQAQAEEVAAEEAAYQEEQTKAEQRREEQLAANQAHHDAEAAQRQQAYERQLEDLRIAYERERKERELSAQQAVEDLKRRGEQERAQLQADRNARLAEIERGLQADTQAFTDAYNNQLRDLDTYLASRLQRWRDHQAAVEAILGISSPSKWMEEIGKEMRAGLDVGFAAPSLATDIEQAVANFGRATSNLALPAGAGGGMSNTTNTTHNHNLQVTANYRNEQSESSLRRDLQGYDAAMRMRVPY